MFEIIKNAPVPHSLANYNKYPFKDMEIGDAFDAPIELKFKVAPAASCYGKRNGKRFSVRNVDDNTIRVFRLA